MELSLTLIGKIKGQKINFIFIRRRYVAVM